MLYSRLGQTGLIVSRLAFGAATFTLGNKTLPTVYRAEADVAEALVGQAIDAGVNFFDTSNAYAFGQSEILLGKALTSRRQDVVLATKVGLRVGDKLADRGLSRNHLLTSIDKSLERLNTDYVDIYIVHRDDPWTPLEETLAALDQIVRSGKARYLGFSNWPAWKVSAAMELQRANGWAPFTHGQMAHSLIDRDIEYDVLPMMRHYGLGLTAWGPLAGGFLSGKYRTLQDMNDPNNRLSDATRMRFDPEVRFALVEKIRGIAEAHSASVAQVAIAWLLARPELTSVILGAIKPPQLADTLGAVNVALTPEEIALLDDATAPTAVYPHSVLKLLTDKPTVNALARRPGEGLKAKRPVNKSTIR